ncbi:hypothetical protein MK805_13855 [Shimazuella sp. AN120528]|uniref:hypothetical protein n=1 Tax=Shimazuella soli TaxID=1892854 RepID=UPI001F0F7E92|nr:hypothetical protein [Shimazuella soli]MCH5586023.1 hypothetical protein [Shimazuella soli]
MLNSIVGWFAKWNWTDWNMWAAIGQMIGAFATVWTARIALRQTKLANQQIDEAREREEETKKKEKEAMEPELTPKIIIKSDEEGKNVLHLILSNLKPVPVYVDAFFFVNKLPEIEDDNQNIIETEAPERVVYGDICVTKVPLLYLKHLITKNEKNEGFYKFKFSISTGKIYTFCVYLKVESKGYITKLYLSNEDVTKEEIIKNGTYIEYAANALQDIRQKGDTGNSIYQSVVRK